MDKKALYERFEFRNIEQGEAEQAAEIERICFPPNEACSEKNSRHSFAGHTPFHRHSNGKYPLQ